MTLNQKLICKECKQPLCDCKILPFLHHYQPENCLKQDEVFEDGSPVSMYEQYLEGS